jgi:hypothetical protein
MERGCNRLRAKELKKKRNTEGTELGALRPTESTLPGVLYGCENKGVARQGICKYVKMSIPVENKGQTKRQWVAGGG